MSSRPTTRLGPIEFDRFSHPPLDVSGGARTHRHEVIDGPDVVDHLGETAKSFTLRGHCDPDTASRIDSLAEQSEHELRHARWSGTVVVEDHSTESDGAFLDPENEIIRYSYTIDMVESVGETE